MTVYSMELSEGNQATYPLGTLKEWACQFLGVQRCSPAYLKALSIVLGNMARADAHGARLILKTIVPWATRQTMRTLLEQLCEAGWLTRWSNPKKATFAYVGRGDRTPEEDPAMAYSRLQREAEDADFKRYLTALGLTTGDCPY